MKPKLTTFLELNKKYGYGYQVRIVLDGIDSVIDDQPFTLDAAYTGSVVAIEKINKATGYDYKPHELIQVQGYPQILKKVRECLRHLLKLITKSE